MTDKWDNITLHVMDYSRPGPSVNLREKPLIPDPTATGPQSVIMGVGRLRRRRSFKGWATPYEYAQLEADYEATQARTITFNDGFTMTALFEKLDGERLKGTERIFYTATVVEA